LRAIAYIARAAARGRAPRSRPRLRVRRDTMGRSGVERPSGLNRAQDLPLDRRGGWRDSPADYLLAKRQPAGPLHKLPVRRLSELRAAAVEPVDAAARANVAASPRARQREENEWNAAHPERLGPDAFRRDVLPALQGVSLGALAQRTGLSVPYLARVRRGEEVPHPRWWEVLGRDAG
jgi:hypothetical protein